MPITQDRMTALIAVAHSYREAYETILAASRRQGTPEEVLAGLVGAIAMAEPPRHLDQVYFTEMAHFKAVGRINEKKRRQIAGKRLIEKQRVQDNQKRFLPPMPQPREELAPADEMQEAEREEEELMKTWSLEEISHFQNKIKTPRAAKPAAKPIILTNAGLEREQESNDIASDQLSGLNDMFGA